MFVFGHIGITLGAAVLAEGLVTEIRSAARKNRALELPRLKPPPGRAANHPFFLMKWFDSLNNFVDIRILIIGSLLPDIIDKPVGFFLFGNGRIITHTLLVTLIVLALGIFLSLDKKKSWLLALAIGMASHLVLDRMWLNPRVFLWPLQGWSFARIPQTNWIVEWISSLQQNYRVDIPELIGLAIILLFLGILASRGQLLSFLKRGIVQKPGN